MQLKLICIGTKSPSWVKTGVEQYQKRMPKTCSLQLIEIPAAKNHSQQQLALESQRMLAAIPKRSEVVACDVLGTSYTSNALAQQLNQWLLANPSVSFLVGGPDGLAPSTLARANSKWSLSPLTLPHTLVRVIIVEQLYRAWTLLQGHPYHRS